ncbi:unnamed protein product, partial [Mesorhabditis belari]|uniref:Forkhead box protein O n=1 Tax=Mesorhabditis belari TaxID=2138241 RepID=A0AAF3EFI5_9BILA
MDPHHLLSNRDGPMISGISGTSGISGISGISGSSGISNLSGISGVLPMPISGATVNSPGALGLSHSTAGPSYLFNNEQYLTTQGFEESEHSASGDEFPPMARDRCNTWPLRRPGQGNEETSPTIQEAIQEEGSLYDSSENLGAGPNSTTIVGSPDPTGFSPGMASPTGYGGGIAPSSGASDTSDPGQPQGKKSATRRNAWGSMSYADLITQAIMQSPEKRLTLAQVYEWMVQNVPYFRDKGDSNSSAGWKNSIRHNLSLHSRFMRIQNEGAGKSSWWVINPDAKPGRNPRRTRDRAATADSKTIGNLKETRRKARNRVKDIRAMMGGSVSSSQVSISSHEPLFADDPNFPPMFRDRANSALTNPASRVSPSMEGFNDFDFPPWVDASAPPQIPADIVDRTQEIRLEGCIDANSPAFRRTLLNGINGEHKEMKTAKLELQDPPMMQTAPPSYHELNAVRSQNQQMQNPLLRNAALGQLPKQGGSYGFSPYSTWNMSPGMSLPTTQSCASQQVASMGSLPVDLENLTLPDQPLMEMDMEAVLRHELSQTNNQLNFDI